MSSHILERLFQTLRERKSADPASSYVARLYQSGTAKCAQKFGEESVETIIEAMKMETGDLEARDLFKQESADALFHLMVLWSQLDVTPDEIFAVLETRIGKISDKDLQ